MVSPAGSLHMLDTCVCVDILRGHVSSSKSLPTRNTVISAITAGELWTGLAKMGRDSRKTETLRDLFSVIPVLDFTLEAARHYGEIRAHLEKAGRPIGPMDLLIAAHAQSLRATLVTGNLDEFKRVPALKCLAWKP